jgi:hypothetical protein
MGLIDREYMNESASLGYSDVEIKLKDELQSKENELLTLDENIEQLKLDLSELKYNYENKIGKLYIRLDKAELYIIIYKQIGTLVDNGIDFTKAKHSIEELFKDKIANLEEEEKAFTTALENDKLPEISDDERNNIKQLWRKLSRVYHPDLINGNEKMMQRINQAYSEHDFATLINIDKMNVATFKDESSLEKLKEKLIKISQLLNIQKEQYDELCKSKWFTLLNEITVARNNGRNILSELELTIMSSIETKEKELSKLKACYE